MRKLANVFWLFVGLVAVSYLAFTVSQNAKARQELIDSSPNVQQMIKEITVAEKHDLLINEYQDKGGENRTKVWVVYQNGRSYLQIIEYVGQAGGDFNAIKRSFEDLAFKIDKVVKPDDPEYPKYAAMFVQQ
jgi:hypothetical protein